MPILTTASDNFYYIYDDYTLTLDITKKLFTGIINYVDQKNYFLNG